MRKAEYHSNFVHSVYFSDFYLPSLWQKLESSYYKNKYRIRTYSDSLSAFDDGDCFIEIKKRLGSRRIKQRKELDSSLFKYNDFNELCQSTHARELFSGKAPFPLFHLAYKRIRFQSRDSDLRVSIDSEMKLLSHNKSIFGPKVTNDDIANTLAVIEFKAKELKHIESAFRQFNIKHEKSFSKFALASQILRQKKIGIFDYGSISATLSSDACE